MPKVVAFSDWPPGSRDDTATDWDTRFSRFVGTRWRGRLLGPGQRPSRRQKLPELWAGTDAGKAEHHCTVIDADGVKVLSRRVPTTSPNCWN